MTKISRFDLLLALWMLIGVLILIPGVSNAGESINKLLPGPSDLQGWRLDGDPQIVHGEKLFELINGGAELYLKLGFKSAASAVYVDSKDSSMNLEIYEMKTPEAAASVYENKTGGEKENIQIGDKGRLDEYYLNFVAGSFQVTVSVFEPGDSAAKAMTALARAVEKLISANK